MIHRRSLLRPETRTPASRPRTALGLPPSAPGLLTRPLPPLGAAPAAQQLKGEVATPAKALEVLDARFKEARARRPAAQPASPRSAPPHSALHHRRRRSLLAPRGPLLLLLSLQLRTSCFFSTRAPPKTPPLHPSVPAGVHAADAALRGRDRRAHEAPEAGGPLHALQLGHRGQLPRGARHRRTPPRLAFASPPAAPHRPRPSLAREEENSGTESLTSPLAPPPPALRRSSWASPT